MKKLLLSLLIIFTSSQIFAQVVTKQIENLQVNSSNAVAFRLFPTQNMWTFIKLNTKNGQMWQVQFDIKGNDRGASILSNEALVSKDKEINDRFTLYPTQNVYTFILLDQLEGKTWQVQWSPDINNRGIIRID